MGGVGDVLAGRVEQGQVKPGEEVVFLPTHTASNPCTGKVFTVEMHHSRVDFANPGDNVGLNIKGLDKNNMPHLQDHMEDGKGDRRQEIGGPSLAEVQRDGGVLLPASAASRVRQLQE